VPHVNGGVLFQYEKVYHVAVITKLAETGFWVKEGNYKRCEIGYRFVFWQDEAILGFML
jgi:hypothetical protein